jgi:hypothetical protein
MRLNSKTFSSRFSINHVVISYWIASRSSVHPVTSDILHNASSIQGLPASPCLWRQTANNCCTQKSVTLKMATAMFFETLEKPSTF